MKLFVKVDANFDAHPRSRRAGLEGRDVIQLAWRLAKRFGRSDGDITNLWDVDYLSEEGGFPPGFASRGMASCEVVGFVELVGGKVFIHDWMEEQGDQREQWAEQKRRQRERRVARTFADSPACPADVRKCPPDKIREEKKDTLAGARSPSPACTSGTAKETAETARLSTISLSPDPAAPLMGDATEVQGVRSESVSFATKPAKVPPEPAAVLRAQALRSAILRWKPDHRFAAPNAWTPAVCNRWARDLNLLRTRLGAWDRIDAVIAWLPTNDFWAMNVQTPQALRKHFDRLEAELRKPRLRGTDDRGPTLEDYRYKFGGEK